MDPLRLLGRIRQSHPSALVGPVLLLQVPVTGVRWQLILSGAGALCSVALRRQATGVHLSGYAAGPWILNCVSGWAHKAVKSADSKFALACRPNARLHSGYEVWESDPRAVGFQRCLHSGCH